MRHEMREIAKVAAKTTIKTVKEQKQYKDE